MLWLALHLPSLPLEALAISPTLTPPEPWAVIERHQRSEEVITCNEAACALGIVPGQRRSAAQALATRLHFAYRQPSQEAAMLESLASWSLQFTPTVSLDPPDGLLLEIEGCQTYFKGLPRLISLISTGLADLGLTVRQGISPTPLASSWFARVGYTSVPRTQDELVSALNDLPLAALPLPAKLLQRIQGLGLTQVGELLDLPRAGRVKRLGLALQTQLDRALGLLPDPRPTFTPPETFERQIELNWASDQVEALSFVVKRLLAELASYLQGRALGVQQISIRLVHENKTHSEMLVAFGKPTRDTAMMLAVSRERLGRQALTSPVCRMGIVASQLHRLDGEALNLFDNGQQPGNFELLRARLAARLGESAVRQITTVTDHRPEFAWALNAQHRPPPQLVLADRPGWLLPQPIPLEIRQQQLWHGEALTLLGRAERIESGWWDGVSVARDYYQAESSSGRRYWIYQQRGTDSWFLHGLFA